MIKKTTFRAVTVALFFSICGCTTAAKGTDDFYVAPDGSDKNTGTLEKPFLTIDRARVAVRKKLKAGQQKDIVVSIRGGVYTMNETVKFDGNDSGVDGYKVIYRNHPGEKPVFSGGRKVVGWTRVPGSDKWTAKLTGVDNSRELYVDGVLATRARGEKIEVSGWKAADNPDMQKHRQVEAVKTYQGELPVFQGYKTTDRYSKMANWRNISDIEFVYEHGWTFVICPVDTITPAKNGGVIVKMRNPCFRDSQIKGGLHVGDPNYIENAYELLDQPGEWYFDRSKKDIYYIPLPGQDMQKVDVVIPAVETFLEVKGSLDRPVRDITFQGLKFEYSTFLTPSRTGFAEIQGTLTKNPNIDDNAHSHFVKTTAAILLDAAESIRFERCEFARFGAACINIQNGSKNNTISGCRLTEIGGSGIQIGGFNTDDAHPDDLRKIVKDNTVSNCYLNKIGTIYKSAIGVNAGYTDGTTIIHNDISDIGYTGISIGWGWGYWDKGNRKDAPAHYKVFDKPTVSKRNRVEYNHLYRTIQKLHDGGAIYGLSMMEDSVIKSNLIHDANGWPGGIYLDEASGGFEVTENIIYNVEKPYHYHEVGIQGRQQTCNVHGNYFNIKPGQENWPAKIAEKAGLEKAYKDIKY